MNRSVIFLVVLVGVVAYYELISDHVVRNDSFKTIITEQLPVDDGIIVGLYSKKNPSQKFFMKFDLGGNNILSTVLTSNQSWDFYDEDKNGEWDSWRVGLIKGNETNLYHYSSFSGFPVVTIGKENGTHSNLVRVGFSYYNKAYTSNEGLSVECGEFIKMTRPIRDELGKVIDHEFLERKGSCCRPN